MTDGSEGSWLAGTPQVERMDLGRGAWVDVVRGLVPDAQRVHDDVADAVAWQQGRVFRYEKWVDEPRLGGFQRGGDRHPALVQVEEWLSRRYRIRFEGYALARYRHAADSQAFHRDRELRWLEETLIGVLSLGATRPWLLKPIGSGRHDVPGDREGDGADVLDLRPAGGDLLVMGGRCQATWLHAVPKVHGGAAVGDRISVQWRWTSRRGRPDTNPGYRAPRHYSR